WFDAVDSAVVGALLETWPTLGELQRCHPGTLRRFFHEHNCRGEERIQKRIAAIGRAMPATEDEAIVAGQSALAQGLVRVIAELNREIAEYDRRIAAVVAVHPESGLFQSLPGAGPVLVPRLIAAFGTRRECFATAYQMQCYSGIAPVTEASG